MDADDKVAASGQEGQPVRAKSPLRYPRHAAPRRYCMQYFERLLLRSPTVCSVDCGSSRSKLRPTTNVSISPLCLWPPSEAALTRFFGESDLPLPGGRY